MEFQAMQQKAADEREKLLLEIERLKGQIQAARLAPK